MDHFCGKFLQVQSIDHMIKIKYRRRMKLSGLISIVEMEFYLYDCVYETCLGVGILTLIIELHPQINYTSMAYVQS